MSQPQPLMHGKRGLIMGVANDRSLAWGIAKALHDHGAELAFTYQGEALEKRVRPLADSIGAQQVLECDVTNAASIDSVFDALGKTWGKLDFLVHAIGFSDKNELKGRYIDTSFDNFALTMNVSCYSFTAVMQRAEKLMTDGGSALTLTYYGAERVMPHYNVMGVAKAALEASVRYLANDFGPRGGRRNERGPGVGAPDRPSGAPRRGGGTGAVAQLAARVVRDWKLLSRGRRVPRPLTLSPLRVWSVVSPVAHDRFREGCPSRVDRSGRAQSRR